MSFRPTPPDKVAVTIHTMFNFHRYIDLDNKWMQMLVSLPPANEVWGKVIFSEACVENSVHKGGGGALPQCMLGYPPGSRHPPGGRHPPPPGADSPRSRHPQEQNHPGAEPHPGAEHAGRYGQGAGGTHPTRIQSCLLFLCRAHAQGDATNRMSELLSKLTSRFQLQLTLSLVQSIDRYTSQSALK